MILLEGAESCVDSKKNKPISLAAERSEQGDGDASKKEAAQLPGPHTERKRPEEDCLLDMVEGRRVRDDREPSSCASLDVRR